MRKKPFFLFTPKPLPLLHSSLLYLLYRKVSNEKIFSLLSSYSVTFLFFREQISTIMERKVSFCLFSLLIIQVKDVHLSHTHSNLIFKSLNKIIHNKIKLNQKKFSNFISSAEKSFQQKKLIKSFFSPKLPSRK
jgi:hypothetical protein